MLKFELRSWVQSLMNAYLNVSCSNAIHIHIHHGGYTNMYIMLNGVKTFLLTKSGNNNNNNNNKRNFMACKFVMKILIGLHNLNIFVKLFIYDDVVHYSTSY